MVKRSNGKMNGYSRLMGRNKRKLTIADYIKEFEENEVVLIDIQPKMDSMPPLRYKNKSGKIIGKQGKVYKVQIKDGKKTKVLLVSPIHLKRLKK